LLKYFETLFSLAQMYISEKTLGFHRPNAEPMTAHREAYVYNMNNIEMARCALSSLCPVVFLRRLHCFCRPQHWPSKVQQHLYNPTVG